jgi:hypothetical protein
MAALKKTDGSNQPEKFKAAARQLACDESEDAFDEKLKVIAPPKTKRDDTD